MLEQFHFYQQNILKDKFRQGIAMDG